MEDPRTCPSAPHPEPQPSLGVVGPNVIGHTPAPRPSGDAPQPVSVDPPAVGAFGEIWTVVPVRLFGAGRVTDV
jgi:hypothetical protein